MATVPIVFVATAVVGPLMVVHVHEKFIWLSGRIGEKTQSEGSFQVAFLVDRPLF